MNDKSGIKPGTAVLLSSAVLLFIAFTLFYGIRYGGAREDILISAYVRIDEKYTARYSYDHYIDDIWEDILVHSAGEVLVSDNDATFYRIKGRDNLSNIIVEIDGRRFLGEFESLYDADNMYDIACRPELLSILQTIYNVKDEKDVKKVKVSYRENKKDIKMSNTDAGTLALFSSVLLCHHVDDKNLYNKLLDWPDIITEQKLIGKYGSLSTKMYNVKLEYFYNSGTITLIYNSITGSVNFNRESVFLLPDELNKKLMSLLEIKQ